MTEQYQILGSEAPPVCVCVSFWKNIGEEWRDLFLLVFIHTVLFIVLFFCLSSFCLLLLLFGVFFFKDYLAELAISLLFFLRGSQFWQVTLILLASFLFQVMQIVFLSLCTACVTESTSSWCGEPGTDV